VDLAAAARQVTSRGGDDALIEWHSAAACARGRFRPDGYGQVWVQTSFIDSLAVTPILSVDKEVGHSRGGHRSSAVGDPLAP
jgi:hypothetical protein